MKKLLSILATTTLTIPTVNSIVAFTAPISEQTRTESDYYSSTNYFSTKKSIESFAVLSENNKEYGFYASAKDIYVLTSNGDGTYREVLLYTTEFHDDYSIFIDNNKLYFPVVQNDLERNIGYTNVSEVETKLKTYSGNGPLLENPQIEKQGITYSQISHLSYDNKTHLLSFTDTQNLYINSLYTDDEFSLSLPSKGTLFTRFFNSTDYLMIMDTNQDLFKFDKSSKTSKQVAITGAIKLSSIIAVNNKLYASTANKIYDITAFTKNNQETLDLNGGYSFIEIDSGVSITSLEYNQVLNKYFIPTNKGGYYLSSLDSANDLEKIDSINYSTYKVAGSGYGMYNYKVGTKTVGYTRPYIDATLEQLKINLTKEAITKNELNALSEEVASTIISNNSWTGKISVFELAGMMDLIKVQSHNPGTEFDNWYVQTEVKLKGQFNNKSLIVSTNTNLSTFELNLEYTDKVSAGTIDDPSAIIAELNKKVGPYLEVQNTGPINIKDGEKTTFTVAPKSGLTTSGQSTGKLNVTWKNVVTPLDLESIKQAIEATKFDASHLDTSSSQADFIKIIQNSRITNIDKVDIQFKEEFKPNSGTWNTTIVITEKGNPTNSKDVKVTFTGIKVSLKGEWTTGGPDKLMEGKNAVFTLNDPNSLGKVTVISSDDTIVTGSEAGGIVTFNAKKKGNAKITISAENAKNKITQNLTVHASGIDLGTNSIQVKQNKTTKYKINNAAVLDLSTLKVNVPEEYKGSVQVSVDNKNRLVVKGLQETPEEFTIQVSFETIYGDTVSENYTVKVLPATGLAWWIILIIVLLLLLLLGIVGWFVWKQYIEPRVKHKKRLPQITADRNAVKKAKVTPTAKITHDKGIERSGVFKRELEYNLDKLDDPDYENKYIWLQENQLEDNSPVVNHWTTEEEQSRNFKEKSNVKKKK